MRCSNMMSNGITEPSIRWFKKKKKMLKDSNGYLRAEKIATAKRTAIPPMAGRVVHGWLKDVDKATS